MIELSQPCESMLKECSWKSISRPCMEIFKFVKTSNGFCCTFNYFGSTEVQVLGEKEEDYRYYTGGAGIHFGLTVLLDPEVEEYISSIRPLPGFDVGILFKFKSVLDFTLLLLFSILFYSSISEHSYLLTNYFKFYENRS